MNHDRWALQVVSRTYIHPTVVLMIFLHIILAVNTFDLGGIPIDLFLFRDARRHHRGGGGDLLVTAAAHGQ